MSDIRLPSSGFYEAFRRECLTAVRNRSELFNPLIFFLSIIMFVPLGVSPDAKALAPIAPGMIWIVALLALLLSLDKVFQSDYEDGCLEQMLLSGQSMYLVVIAKVLAHWCFTGLLLTLLSPVLGLMMALPGEAYIALMASLLLGTGALSFIGAVGAALTVSLRRGGLLLSLIIIPLYVPVLIFGTSAVRSAALGDPWTGPLAVVAAMCLCAMMLAPLAVVGALKISLEN
ncbi:heme exporter protein CcmB [Agaribacterium haliotis]|uniref:heme exporter protein CcmB n=1 Tax=Agaribacterium haliotis TaxID=2013869 RepID=UPI000BB545DF|nr:heme exporter protein CcmB [Agaribacterium haliotis]